MPPSSSIPSEMKAYSFATRGDPTEVLHKVTTFVPSPLPNQVLLKVHAAALNPLGFKAIKYFPSSIVKQPCIPECDVAGTVVAVGKNVKQWNIGDRVYGVTPTTDFFKTGRGALAEYTIVKEQDIYRKPDFLSWEEASAISLAALTAYQALLSDPMVPLSKGQSVFINGGSGGVGLFAIQIARHIVSESGRIVTSCSSRNSELVKKHGADEAIDYTSVDLPTYLSQTYSNARFDLVLDCVGSFELFNASPGFLNARGDFVRIAMDVPQSFWEFLTLASKLAQAMLLPTILGGVPRRFKVTRINIKKEHVEAVGSLVQDREIAPVLDSTWKFNENGVKGAYTRIMTGHARGKVVIKIAK